MATGVAVSATGILVAAMGAPRPTEPAAAVAAPPPAPTPPPVTVVVVRQGSATAPIAGRAQAAPVPAPPAGPARRHVDGELMTATAASWPAMGTPRPFASRTAIPARWWRLAS